MYSEVDTDIKVEKLVNAFDIIRDKFDLSKPFPTIAITSLDGEDDWVSSTAKTDTLTQPEKDYNVLNKSLKGSYFETLVNKFSDYYRWRVMCVPGKRIYNVHTDHRPYVNGDTQNIRIHIPIITNEGCFFTFWDSPPQHGKQNIVRSIHMEPGKAYQVNTTNYHSFLNLGTEYRYHLIGVKYV